jgi:5-methylcytosine-specific restriction endonuclease McrA
VHLGFASFGEYVERLFGYTRRSTQEKLRVAEALEQLPMLANALASGQLSWSATRELTRVVAPETEQAWIDAAVGKSVRQLEECVADKSPGDGPDAIGSVPERRHVLRFDVSAETFALFREALQTLRHAAGQALEDDAALLALARHVLGGPKEEGRASYQTTFLVCPRCSGGSQLASGERVPVAREVVEMALCDAQRLPAPAAANDTESGAVPAPSAPRAHVGARASQTIPPAVRRAVLLRDQRRCRVPGCRHCTYLDVHHVLPRSEGGLNEAANLLTLCGAHHRAVHRGELLIEGSADAARFRHGDGSDYGQPLKTAAHGLHDKVFAALRGLGFREEPTRRVLNELRRLTPSPTTPESLLRAALQRLTSPLRAEPAH